jgi:hypothetical protein
MLFDRRNDSFVLVSLSLTRSALKNVCSSIAPLSVTKRA